ncbi:hypothetical protein [Haladaptatus sp. YSMS36]|uniref:hypothetical protein n=1 Tax=Haladaptatus sp. YSMS36 TaxID=3033384 RepID=UPI0023E82FE1|nr:hypothetical protein [Haladaptatus sp. YSMS36]
MSSGDTPENEDASDVVQFRVESVEYRSNRFVKLRLWNSKDWIIRLGYSGPIDTDWTPIALSLCGHEAVVLENNDGTLDGVSRVLREPTQLPNRERLVGVVEEQAEDIVRGFMPE